MKLTIISQNLVNLIKFLSAVYLFSVKVPVLSLQRTSIPVISSIAVFCLVNAPCCESLCYLIAIVTERTVGIANRIPPISNPKRLSIPDLYSLCRIVYITIISTAIPTAMEQIQKFPIVVRTFWKCPPWFVLSTRCAAFSKKVWTPVAMTTASSSPC
ncbi:hypothetical protein HanXRQr2_Chr06g0274101 [Helianthus annuus]|uniref:Uncharacterized protein n=1 Tax=Helianthus annuus TaxID=4232 RepID=A0A9K3IV24_HELAN|nr:hypothetical protein HanXRQr2_Chr06g0274101 [Helianthus annuus]KAJ0916694.1 hypothetical protein HanPSC8_Chr06g0264751 [Helianthus annuus]